MDITISYSDYYDRAEVSAVLPSGGRPASVEVYGPDVRFGDLRPARVNWSAHGASSPEDAAGYARLILAAVEVARELDAKLDSDVAEAQRLGREASPEERAKLRTGLAAAFRRRADAIYDEQGDTDVAAAMRRLADVAEQEAD